VSVRYVFYFFFLINVISLGKINLCMFFYFLTS